MCVCVGKVCKCEVRVEWLLTDALGVSVYVAKCLKHVTALKCLYACVCRHFVYAEHCPFPVTLLYIAIFVLVFVFVVCGTSCFAVSP